ncbi:hypothetical protein BJ742DRAFT_291269 [Cladochytrium replicatum]|nr:hypothetical protein BJ742DRAFT_291269 [Cladochytrium replicatum]
MGLAERIKQTHQLQQQAQPAMGNGQAPPFSGYVAPGKQHPPSLIPQNTGAPPPYNPFADPNTYADPGAQPSQNNYLPPAGAPPPTYATGVNQQAFMVAPSPQPTQPQQFGVPQSTLTRGKTTSRPQLHSLIKDRINTIAQVNNLAAFYSPQSLSALGDWICQNVDFDQVAARWNMQVELALDLACLALYDIVIYADDSGSMVFEEAGSRIDDLKMIAAKVSEIATMFDTDGISVRFMKEQREGDNLRTPDECDALISSIRFAGMTPLGTALEQRVIRPFVIDRVNSQTMKKPVLVIIVTDGEPVGEPRDKLVSVISTARDYLSRTRYGAGAIAIEIAQVGKDLKAQRFLEEVDNHPVIGRYVDVTSYYELEEQEFKRKGVDLTPELWLLKLMVGAIDPSYDDKD